MLEKGRQAVRSALFFAIFASSSLSAQPFFAQVGEKMRMVAQTKATIQNPIQFGTSWASDSQSRPTNEPFKQKILGFILIQKPISLYLENGDEAGIQLEGNLRYPFVSIETENDEIVRYKVLFNQQTYLIKASDVEADNGIPVITYHHILQDSENKRFTKTSTTTSDTAFAEQLSIMQELGFESIDLYQLEKFLQGNINLPAKALAITFDDGLKSVYRYGYPLLKKYGFKATMFVITSRIKYYDQAWDPDSLQFLDREEFLAMSDLFDWQSHTHFLHRYLNKKPLLPQVDLRQARLDFERSLRELKQFNPTPAYLSYPFGGYNPNAIQAAKDAGMRLAVTTKIGKVKFGDDPYQLKRVYLLRTDSREKVIKTLQN